MKHLWCKRGERNRRGHFPAECERRPWGVGTVAVQFTQMSEVSHCRSETPSFRFIHALSVLIEDNEMHLQGALICKWNPRQGTIHQVPILAIKTNIVMAIHKWMAVFNVIYNDANTDWNRAVMNGRVFNGSSKSDYFWDLYWLYIWF